MSLSSPAVRSIVFVEFLLGNVQIIRICNSNVDRDFAGNTYSSHPELSVSLPARHGALAMDTTTLEVQASKLDFIRNLTKDRAYYPVIKVRITELVTNLENLLGSKIYHAEGSISSYRSKDGIVTLTLASPMGSLDSESGAAATQECNAGFGDGHGCTVLVESLVETGTIVSHSGALDLTITGLAFHPNYYWMPGTIRKDGQEVHIFYHRDGTSFRTSQRIPVAWQDDLDNAIPVVVEVLPGCRHTPEDCRTLNPNPQEFKGYGIVTPDRNPYLEVLDE